MAYLKAMDDVNGAIGDEHWCTSLASIPNMPLHAELYKYTKCLKDPIVLQGILDGGVEGA